MAGSADRGNNPELWKKLLSSLDEKLQLGLMDYLERVATYHFESEVLYIVPGSEEDHEYLTRGPVLQQLELLAQDAVRVERVKIKTSDE